MARFHPLSLSDTHTHFGARTSLTVVSLLNFYRNLCLLPVSSAPLLPSFLPSQTKVSARQTDNQTGAQSMHKISTHTRRQTCMMCRQHLPQQPNNETALTLIAILFICWQAQKGGLPCYPFPLFLSFSQHQALTFQRLSMRPFSYSLDLESFIYLGYQQRQTTGAASVSLLLIEVPLSAYCYCSNIWSRQSEEEHNGGGKEGVQEIVGAAVVKTRQ